MNRITKSEIIAGLRCPKQLWFDLRDPIRIPSPQLERGKRFGAFAKSHYGSGLDLSEVADEKRAVDITRDAISNRDVSAIYEAAFLAQGVLVRVDVLRRSGQSWQLVEVKSSGSLKDVYVKDAAIQRFVAEVAAAVISATIAHINKAFVYPGNRQYDGLLVEADVTKEVEQLQAEVPRWISGLSPLCDESVHCPSIELGDQCRAPHACNYLARCEHEADRGAEVPVRIVPNIGARLAKRWAAEGIYDLRQLPENVLRRGTHRRIRDAHINDREWISPAVSTMLRQHAWPRYFMDFETIQQGVPLIPHSRPLEQFPFQWSVHVWRSPDQRPDQLEAKSFLAFDNDGMARSLLLTLIETLGDRGPIFAHHASTEIGALKLLAALEDCKDLAPAVERLIARVEDTLEIVRDGFYAPVMMGSSSIKDVIKAIPTTVRYETENGLGGGSDAQLEWFYCTRPGASIEDRAKGATRLTEYCAKDTLALADLIRHLQKPCQ